MRKSLRPSARAAGPPPGTQAIQRAALVLRLLAAGPGGIRFADVVKRSGLQHPTAHRILKGLIAEGLAIHGPGSRHYALGPLVFELGLAARPQLDLASLCAPALDRIAAKTGDTVFLTARSGYDSVCVDRRSGSFPIKTLTLDVGTRRPLGVGAGGLALLLLLGAREVEEIVAANAHRVGSYNNLTASALLASVERSRRLGYALNDVHNTTGATTLGLPIVNRYGHPFAALSVGTISSRMPRERQVEIAAMLRAEIRQIESALRVSMPSPAA
jgi:DNA-binding IclR family transcriptional regulator